MSLLGLIAWWLLREGEVTPPSGKPPAGDVVPANATLPTSSAPADEDAAPGNAPEAPADVRTEAPLLHGVQGKAEATLQPWPVAEVTFVGAEQLAEGSRLTARFAMPETLRDGQQTYRAGGSSGQLRRLLAEHREKSLPIADGKVTLTADADEAELEVTLWIGNHGWPLRQVTPSRIPLGRASTVALAPDEMREAEARLTKQFGGK